jgi:hypothetical protein
VDDVFHDVHVGRWHRLEHVSTDIFQSCRNSRVADGQSLPGDTALRTPSGPRLSTCVHTIVVLTSRDRAAFAPFASSGRSTTSVTSARVASWRSTWTSVRSN